MPQNVGTASTTDLFAVDQHGSAEAIECFQGQVGSFFADHAARVEGVVGDE